MIRAELILRSSTPMLIGWYDPMSVDPRGLRETELKGIWRYWVRAAVAGALYDKGMLVGKPGVGILRVPKKEESEAIACYTGRIMGLGYAGSREAEQSRFRIMIEPLTDLSKVKEIFYRGSVDLQRVSLLLLATKERRKERSKEEKEDQEDRDKEGMEYIKDGVEFKVTIEQTRSRYKDAEEVAIKILILALQLQGMGKGGRRGLGSLDLQRIHPELFSIRSLRALVDDIYSGTLDIIAEYKDTCARELSEGELIEHLPPLPAISKKIHDRDIPTFSIYSTDLSFNEIHNFFLRTHRCKVLFGNPICYDHIRNEHVGWFLGLPRFQKIKDKKSRKTKTTGYIITDRNITRRASPIYVAYHRENNRYGARAFITISLSADWPLTVDWCESCPEQDGTSISFQKPLTLNDKEILKACRIVHSELRQYIGKFKRSLNRVWP